MITSEEPIAESLAAKITKKAAHPIVSLFFVSLLLVVFIGQRQKGYVVDDGYIYAKFATCLVETGAWSFNCNSPPVYATTSPLWTLIVTGLAASSIDLATGLPLINGISTVFLAVAVGFMFSPAPIWFRVGATAVVSTMPVIWQSQGLEVVLAVGLVAWTMIAYSYDHKSIAGILFGLAVLARPDSAIAGLLVIPCVIFLKRPLPVRELIWSMAVVVPWICYSMTAFGSFIPTTLEAKTTQRGLDGWSGGAPLLDALYFQISNISTLIIPLGLAAILVPICLKRTRRSAGQFSDATNFCVLLFCGYGLLHGIAYSIMDTPSAYFWYHIPFLTGAIVLAIYGVLKTCAAVRPLGQLTSAVTGVALMSTLFAACWNAVLSLGPEYRLSSAYQEIGRIVRESAAKNDRVAATEIGYIGFFGNVDVLDIHGLIHPESRDAIKGGNSLWWLDEHPEWIVVHTPRWFGEPGYKGLASDYLKIGYEGFAAVRTSKHGIVELWMRRQPNGMKPE